MFAVRPLCMYVVRSFVRSFDSSLFLYLFSYLINSLCCLLFMYVCMYRVRYWFVISGVLFHSSFLYVGSQFVIYGFGISSFAYG